MTDNFWSGLNRGIGGALDWATRDKWDFDGLGPSPSAVAASDGFSFGDAMDAFTRGYSATMGPGQITPGGSSFLRAYDSSKGAIPTTTPSTSTSSAFTAGGKTHTMPGIIIDEQPDFYAFKDNVQYPVPQGSSGSSGSKGGGFLDTVGKVVGIGSAIASLCDIRTKTDILPLEITEVNDDLAQVAFFVKELRECS